MNREDYAKKVDDLINDGVNQGVYTFTEDKTHEDLHNFRTLIYNSFLWWFIVEQKPAWSIVLHGQDP